MPRKPAPTPQLVYITDSSSLDRPYWKPVPEDVVGAAVTTKQLTALAASIADAGQYQYRTDFGGPYTQAVGGLEVRTEETEVIPLYQRRLVRVDHGGEFVQLPTVVAPPARGEESTSSYQIVAKIEGEDRWKRVGEATDDPVEAIQRATLLATQGGIPWIENEGRFNEQRGTKPVDLVAVQATTLTVHARYTRQLGVARSGAGVDL